jgi:hypothetical protein
MPIPPGRQRHLMRRHPSTKVLAASLDQCADNAAWWLDNCSILPTTTRFHYYQAGGFWRADPYVDTTATERAIDAAVERGA